MSTPFIGFGNDQLQDQPTVRKGDLVACDTCKGVHPVELGKVNGEEDGTLGFISCGDKHFLVSIGGKLCAGVKPAVSGKL